MLIPHADRHRVVLMGESAGGNLAACASLMWRDRQPRGVTVAHQVLLSPCIPTRPLMPSRTDPARANGALLPAWLMEYFEIAYAGSSSVHGADTIVEELAEQPYFNPLAAQSLAGLPPITGVVGGAEVLRDEGVAYFEAAEKAGVDVAFREYEDGYHAFIIFPFGQSAAAWSFVRGRLRGSRVLELRGGAAASIGRRRVLSRVAVTALARPHRAQAVAFKDTLEEGLPGEALLGESSIYAVRVDSSSRALPSASRQSARRLSVRWDPSAPSSSASTTRSPGTISSRPRCSRLFSGAPHAGPSPSAWRRCSSASSRRSTTTSPAVSMRPAWWLRPSGRGGGTGLSRRMRPFSGSAARTV